MNISDFNELIIDSIKQSNRVFKLRNNEINIRCPICGDSTKDSFHSHFYIKIPRDENEPWVCFCHRCNYGGVITSSILRQITENVPVDKELLTNFSHYQHQSIRSSGGINQFNGLKKMMYRKSLKITNSKNPMNQTKLDYINGRLGLHLNFEDLEQYKVILDLNELNQVNQLDLFNQIKNFRYVAENYLGFISHDNQYTILRYVGDILNRRNFSMNSNNSRFKPKRYLNYALFENNGMEGDKFYIIPNEINFLCERLTLNITEGIFDILGVFNHVLQKEASDDTLNIAVCGFSYIKAIEYILSLGFLNLQINLFIDSDKMNEIRRSIRKLRRNPFLKKAEINVLYNGKSKDFGVTQEEIELKKLKI